MQERPGSPGRERKWEGNEIAISLSGGEGNPGGYGRKGIRRARSSISWKRERTQLLFLFEKKREKKKLVDSAFLKRRLKFGQRKTTSEHQSRFVEERRKKRRSSSRYCKKKGREDAGL